MGRAITARRRLGQGGELHKNSKALDGFFSDHPPTTVSTSTTILVKLMPACWDQLVCLISKFVFIKQHPTDLYTPHFRFSLHEGSGQSMDMAYFFQNVIGKNLTRWKKGQDKEVLHPRSIWMIINIALGVEQGNPIAALTPQVAESFGQEIVYKSEEERQETKDATLLLDISATVLKIANDQLNQENIDLKEKVAQLEQQLKQDLKFQEELETFGKEAKGMRKELLDVKASSAARKIRCKKWGNKEQNEIADKLCTGRIIPNIDMEMPLAGPLATLRRPGDEISTSAHRYQSCVGLGQYLMCLPEVTFLRIIELSMQLKNPVSTVHAIKIVTCTSVSGGGSQSINGSSDSDMEAKCPLAIRRGNVKAHVPSTLEEAIKRAVACEEATMTWSRDWNPSASRLQRSGSVGSSNDASDSALITKIGQGRITTLDPYQIEELRQKGLCFQ
eukprot:Gb_06711 [translate_table: standard]